MPWTTPTLKEIRSIVRDDIRAKLPGADASIPNSVLRVMSDSQGALCHLTLQYVDWLALQLLPDTAETEWLDRHGDIWLVNAGGSVGRKMATYATGSADFVGIGGNVVPLGTLLVSPGERIEYATSEEATIAYGDAPTPIGVRAVDPGISGNLDPGTPLALSSPVAGVTTVTVTSMAGGTDTETDDQLRIRVLERIRQPPQGGSASDYVRWAKAVPGCTRAWCTPLEMGIGTVTVRVLFDDLRAINDGWPTQSDLDSVTAYIDQMRPVAVKDFWVVAPVKQFVNVYIANLTPDNNEVRASIETSLEQMMFDNAAPGQTIFATWKAQAIMNTPNVISFDLRDWNDDVMQTPGHMGVLGNIAYVL